MVFTKEDTRHAETRATLLPPHNADGTNRKDYIEMNIDKFLYEKRMNLL